MLTLACCATLFSVPAAAQIPESLRYVAEPGSTWIVELDRRESNRILVDGELDADLSRPVPPTRTWLPLEVQAVDDLGVMTVLVGPLTHQVLPDEGSDPDVVESMRENGSILDGLRGKVVVDSLGFVVHVETAPVRTPGVFQRTHVAELEESLWTLWISLRSGEGPAFAPYRIQATETRSVQVGNGGAIEYVSEATAEPGQEATNEFGGKSELLEYTRRTSGTATIESGVPLPRRARLEIFTRNLGKGRLMEGGAESTVVLEWTTHGADRSVDELIEERRVAGMTIDERLEEAFEAGRRNAYFDVVNQLLSLPNAAELKDAGDRYRNWQLDLEASAHYLMSLLRDPESSIAMYRLAASLTDLSPALSQEWLGRAVEAGFWGGQDMAEAMFWDPFRESDDFKAWTRTVDERYEKILATWEAPSIVRSPLAESAESFPCLVFLHGWGDTHESYVEYAQLAAEHGYVGMALGGTHPFAADRFRWDTETIDETHAAVQRALVRAREVGLEIPADRVFLMGFSQGALHATRLVAEHPEDYAGVLALSIGGRQDLAPMREDAPPRPLFAVWGTAEHEGNVALMEQAKALWQQAGHPYREHVHEGGHHFPESWPEPLLQALSWFAEQ